MAGRRDGATEPARLEAAGEGLRLAGPLTFETVPALVAAQPRHPGKDIDLGGVSHADSAGLALLLEWLASAAAAGEPLAYHNLPDQLSAIARVSNLTTLLPLD